jgi:hypothetical protein
VYPAAAMKKSLIALFLFAAILYGYACAFERQDTRYFRLESDDVQILSYLAKEADTITDAVVEQLGLPLKKPVDVIIASTVEEFQRVQPAGSQVPTWAIGVAYPAQNLIILLSPKAHQRGRIDLVRTFQHEVIHIVLGQAFKGKENVPRWLDEGLAMIAADEWSVSRLSTMTFAALGRKLIPMDEIIGSFPWDPQQAEIAYCQSFYFISFLKGRFGSEAFKQFLQEYVRDKNFRRAIQDAYQKSWPEMEQEWLDYLRLRFSWIPLITSSTTLWFLATLIFLLGYLRKKRMNRLKLAEWTREEAVLSPEDKTRYH